MGTKTGTCPYYATRHAIPAAEVGWHTGLDWC